MHVHVPPGRWLRLRNVPNQVIACCTSLELRTQRVEYVQSMCFLWMPLPDARPGAGRVTCRQLHQPDDDE